jgi:hypothetical protein
LVGEPTSGTASHFGEVRSFLLPHAKLTVNHSTKFFKRTGGGAAIEPEIKAEKTFQQYLDGIDPALEAIAQYTSRASVPSAPSVSGQRAVTETPLH